MSLKLQCYPVSRVKKELEQLLAITMFYYIWPKIFSIKKAAAGQTLKLIVSYRTGTGPLLIR